MAGLVSTEPVYPRVPGKGAAAGVQVGGTPEAGRGDRERESARLESSHGRG